MQGDLIDEQVQCLDQGPAKVPCSPIPPVTRNTPASTPAGDHSDTVRSYRNRLPVLRAAESGETTAGNEVREPECGVCGGGDSGAADGRHGYSANSPPSCPYKERTSVLLARCQTTALCQGKQRLHDRRLALCLRSRCRLHGAIGAAQRSSLAQALRQRDADTDAVPVHVPERARSVSHTPHCWPSGPELSGQAVWAWARI